MARRAGMVLAAASLAVAAAPGPEPLTVVTWGGVYQESQRQALFEPFTAHTGIPVTTVRYDGGLDALRREVEGGSPDWDLIDLSQSDNLAACAEGLIEPLDHDRLPAAPDGTPAREDFIPGALTRCGVTHSVYATVIAFNREAFPGLRPQRVEDLFDTTSFPGRRALQRSPEGNLEWGLLSYDVPNADVYDLLSTSRGMRLALRRLEAVARDALWWEDGARPAQLLADGRAVMATGYNGRFFAAAAAGAPVEIIWDGALLQHETWAIVRGTPQRGPAARFIRFATGTEPLATQAAMIAYGPARRSAAHRVSTHAATGMDMRHHIPTHPHNRRHALVKDAAWYAAVYERIRGRFDRWLEALEGR